MPDDLGVSYTDLGVMVAVFSGASWLCQFPAGVLVDRIGARPVLFAGGALADRIEDRERLVAICLVPYAILLGIAALDILPVDFAVWLRLGAFLVTLAHPAIDLLVLRICPPGKIGTVFGFVAFGGSVGGELVAWGSRALTGSGIPEIAVWLPVPAVLLCVVSIYAARATSR